MEDKVTVMKTGISSIKDNKLVKSGKTKSNGEVQIRKPQPKSFIDLRTGLGNKRFNIVNLKSNICLNSEIAQVIPFNRLNTFEEHKKHGLWKHADPETTISLLPIKLNENYKNKQHTFKKCQVQRSNGKVET
jgi:hypothetical protein